MKVMCLIYPLFFAFSLQAFSVKPEDAAKIGEKIWMNEGKGKEEWLLYWSQKEPFPSLGIGHFIWYPEGYQDVYEQTFPDFIGFLEQKNRELPGWLKMQHGCPWKSREAFYAASDSQEMKSLKKLMLETKSEQLLFMVKRFEKVTEAILSHIPDTERVKYKMLLEGLAQEPRGLYALTDYVNFKGSGIQESERYQNRGWGLLQVMEDLVKNSKSSLEDFVVSAKKVLKERTENAPKEKQEQRWLEGWFNRLDTYLQKI